MRTPDAQRLEDLTQQLIAAEHQVQAQRAVTDGVRSANAQKLQKLQTKLATAEGQLEVLHGQLCLPELFAEHFVVLLHKVLWQYREQRLEAPPSIRLGELSETILYTAKEQQSTV